MVLVDQGTTESDESMYWMSVGVYCIFNQQFKKAYEGGPKASV